MFKNSVNSIIADFNKTITRLEALSTKKAVEIADNDAAIERLQKNSADAAGEQARANTIAKRLKEIVAV